MTGPGMLLVRSLQLSRVSDNDYSKTMPKSVYSIYNTLMPVLLIRRQQTKLSIKLLVEIKLFTERVSLVCCLFVK